jgi:hypothetical protein
MIGNAMLNITRNQELSNDDATLGDAVYGDCECKTLELGWHQNKPNVSCIPTGIYKCRKIVSPSLGECFEVMNVPNRTYIRGHTGNKTSQILGCVAFGMYHVDFDNDGIMDIARSKDAFDGLMAVLPDVFMMEIV